jgi:ribosomal protein L37AE/L43A
MEELKAGFIHLELKYCERCGALWLRPTASDVVFCGTCDAVMAGLPPKLQRRVRPAEAVVISRPAEGAFWVEGGTA